DARARLTRAGADLDAYTAARDWGLERPNVTQVVEARRRGFIGDDLYKRLLKEAGSRPELWETYVQSITEVPSVLDVQLGRNRGIIGADEYRELLSRHGFTLDRNKDILDALRQNIPSLSDLLRMGVRQLFSPEIVGAYRLYQEFPETMRPWCAALGLDWPLNFNVPTEKGNVQASWPLLYWGMTREILPLGSAYLAYQRLRAENMPMYRREVPDLQPFELKDLEYHMRVAGFPPPMRDFLVALS